MRNLLIALLLVSFVQHAAEASEKQTANGLRPLAPDRPSVTNGTQTVDSGHFQLEVDIVSYLNDPETYSFGTTNFKVGVLDNVDFQFIWTPWVKTRGETMSSNLTIRSKINIWGNDRETATSFAVIPFVELPTEHGKLEGGVFVPFAMPLPKGWTLGAEVRLAIVKDVTNDYVLDTGGSAIVSHAISGPLSGYVEVASYSPGDSTANWYATLNGGLQYNVDENVQVDVNMQVGLNGDAPDLLIYTGFTWRF